MPSYCGIKFNQKQLIDSVALYFYVPDVEGIDIMSIQIQALIDGEYKTLVTTKSYNEEQKYSPAFKFDPVETDDIRILYTAGNGTFANLKEIEIYSPNGKAPMFDGLGQMAEPPTFIDCTTKAVVDDSIGRISTTEAVLNAPAAVDAYRAISGDLAVQESASASVSAVVASAICIVALLLLGVAYARARKNR